MTSSVSSIMKGCAESASGSGLCFGKDWRESAGKMLGPIPHHWHPDRVPVVEARGRSQETPGGRILCLNKELQGLEDAAKIRGICIRVGTKQGLSWFAAGDQLSTFAIQMKIKRKCLILCTGFSRWSLGCGVVFRVAVLIWY